MVMDVFVISQKTVVGNNRDSRKTLPSLFPASRYFIQKESPSTSQVSP